VLYVSICTHLVVLRLPCILVYCRYLFSPWDSEYERNQLWIEKRGLFKKVSYTVPEAMGAPYAGRSVTVQVRACLH
jgi:hypothetical protein